jgi:hypothetical protein
MFSGRMLDEAGGAADQVCKHGQELDDSEQTRGSAETGELDPRAGEKRDKPPPASLEARKKFKIAGF